MMPLLTRVQQSSATLIRTSLQCRRHVMTLSCVIPQLSYGYYGYSYFTQAAASTKSIHNETVPLAYEYYTSSQATLSSPLVVLHGLFGSKQNWRSLARGLAQRLSASIYAVDLRNHGDSPHTSRMGYAVMAADVERFIDEQQLKQVTIVGHSMGAHVAMALALSKRIQDRLDYLERVILVDKAPRDMALDRVFSRYIEGMQLVERAGVERQSDADQLLVPYVPDLSVRQFLLTNLKRDTTNQNRKYQFRVPLDTIARTLPSLGQLQLPADYRPFDRPTLFVAGSRSDYIRPQDHEGIYKLFPQAKIEYLDTGHWVQVEKPAEFMQLVTQFYQS